MSVQQVHRKIGGWSVQLTADAPASLLASLDYFGHVVIVPGRMSPVERGDELLDAARYVGILRTVEAGDQVTLSGVGLEAWVGDEEGKGTVIETPGVTLTSATFAAAVAAVLKPSAPAGTIYTGVAGTITNTFSYVTPRTALDYLCDTMGGEWRTRSSSSAPHCVVDAGPAASLFRMTPTCVIVRRGAGQDLTLKALPGQVATTRDAKGYSSRVVLIASALAGGTADAATIPYKDLNGNPVAITRVIDEQDDTLIANAPARAAAALAQWNGIGNTIRLSANDFDIAGDFAPGDAVWVYDPDGGVYDTANQVEFRGRTLQPAAVRVLSLTWPVERGYTVAYRDGTGSWTDLTPWVAWEDAGGGEIEVADSTSASLTPGIGSIGTQVTGGGGGAGDAAVPDVPVFGAFTTSSYQSGDGLPRASVKPSWAQPLNTDSSTIVDGDHYDLRYRNTGTLDWTQALVPWSQTSFAVVNLPPSTGMDWQIRAVDYATPVNEGAWSATTTFTTAQDTTPPGVPAAPVVAASRAAVMVSSTLGLASGGSYNLPLDMRCLQVHIGTGTGFVTSAATLAGRIPANAGMLQANIQAIGSFPIAGFVTPGAVAYVKLIAEDLTGNVSAASAAASATADLWDSAYISSLNATLINSGQLNAALILAGSVKTATSGQRVEFDSTGLRLYDSGGIVKVNLNASTGAATFAGSLSAATGTFAGSLSAATGTFAGSLSAATGSFSGAISASTITGSTLQTAASGARITIGTTATNRIDFYNSSGGHGYVEANTSGTNAIGVYSNNGTEFLLAINGTCSINSSSGVVSANSSGTIMSTTGGSTASVQTSSGNVTVTAATTCTIGAGGFNPSISIGGTTSAISLGGGSGGSLTLRPASIGVSNIPQSAQGTSPTLYMTAGRLMQANTSSRRNKLDIRDLDGVTPGAVLAMRPVSFLDRWQVEHAENPSTVDRQVGMVAEEVDEIPGLGTYLVGRDDDGQVFNLAYHLLPVVQQVALRSHEERIAELERRLLVS